MTQDSTKQQNQQQQKNQHQNQQNQDNNQNEQQQSQHRQQQRQPRESNDNSNTKQRESSDNSNTKQRESNDNNNTKQQQCNETPTVDEIAENAAETFNKSKELIGEHVSKVQEFVEHHGSQLSSHPKMQGIREHYGFYSQYHNHPGNRLIHIISIPTILVCTIHFIRLATLPLLNLHFGPFELSISSLLTFALGLSYFPMDKTAATYFLPLLYVAHNAASTALEGKNILAAVLFFGGWIAQFTGHRVLEKNRPAFFERFFPALHAAPFFVYMEVLLACGYNPKLKKFLDSDLKRRANQATKWGNVKQTASDAASKVSSKASDVADKIKGEAQDAKRWTHRQVTASGK